MRRNGTDAKNKLEDTTEKHFRLLWYGTYSGGKLEVKKSGIQSATEDPGLGLFAKAAFTSEGQVITYFENDNKYTCEEGLKMNVENLDHVVNGLTRWHDETRVLQSFIQDGTHANGTWVPKQGVQDSLVIGKDY